jgi:hypothetical protein
MLRLTPIARWDRLLVALALNAVLVSGAQATVVPAVGLDQMVSDADLIVRGTVSEVEPRWSEDHTTIHTYVTFTNVSVIHGQLFGPLTLRFEGGEVGKHRVEVDGMPAFRRGDEEILFVRGNDVSASPVVGLFQGRFKVVEGRVHDHAGAPIVGVSDGTLVKLIDDRPARAAGGGMSIGSPAQAVYEYAERPDVEQIEAELVAAVEASKRGRYPKAGQGKGTGVDHTGAKDEAVAAPPRAVSGAAAATSAAKPAAIYVPLSQDNGQRLTATAFIDAIRARLGE